MLRVALWPFGDYAHQDYDVQNVHTVRCGNIFSLKIIFMMIPPCSRHIMVLVYERKRIRYKVIGVQAPISSSSRSPWFFNVPSVQHRYTRGYLWVSNPEVASRVSLLVGWETRSVSEMSGLGRVSNLGPPD